MADGSGPEVEGQEAMRVTLSTLAGDVNVTYEDVIDLDSVLSAWVMVFDAEDKAVGRVQAIDLNKKTVKVLTIEDGAASSEIRSADGWSLRLRSRSSGDLGPAVKL